MTMTADNTGSADYSQDEPAEADLLDSSDLPVEVQGYSKGRVERVRQAVREWTRQLIDLGGRNNLLHYRDLKAGTLDLSKAEPVAIEKLLASKTVKVSALFTEEEAREQALRRVRTIHKKAKENFEERGIETLLLACGLATWENKKTTWVPRAPVILRQATLHPLGASQNDFEITLVDEANVNQTLLQALKRDFDCDVDEDELLRRVDGPIDEWWELETAYEWIKEHAVDVTDFSVSPRLVLANFAYAKLPMVKDLETAFDELVGHDLIAAIAGDEGAREAVRAAAPAPGDVLSPDHMPLGDEFLILDADASQNYAINAVLAGASLIVRGPPGTGKSQTISNLIGSLVAHGKKVLFVAEKRAAIDAVLKRLHQQKLGDLVLDLHGKITSRRAFAETIGRALAGSRTAGRVENEADLRRLEKRRKELNGYQEALHKDREPWNISIFEVRNELMKVAAGRNEIRFDKNVLAELDADTADQVEEDLAEYAGLGGVTLKASSSPWAEATIEHQQDVEEANALVDELRREVLPAILRSLSEASTSAGMPPAETLDDWKPRLVLSSEIRETLAVFDSEVYGEDLGHLVEALAPADKGGLTRLGASLFSADYKDARSKLRALRLDKKRVPVRELLASCKKAKNQLRRWRKLGGTDNPVAFRDGEELASNYHEVCAQVRSLEGWTGATAAGQEPIDDLRAWLEALADDRSTLIKLPRLHELRVSLSEAGLGALLVEMENGQASEEDCRVGYRYTWLQSILDQVSLTDMTIGGFVADKHDKAVEDFRSGDQAHIKATSARIRRICAEQAVSARDKFPEQDRLIRHQAALKRRHRPVRETIDVTSDVLLGLKPCWVMSPLVVSQLLPPSTRFDVVIFDEASQITPADAVSSILRGNQLVVAGDERQLPPTAFFLSEDADDDDVEALEGHDGALVSGTKGFESILDALGYILPHPRMLQWHYRSRDERLIAFSNAHIYDRMLTTFPGVGGDKVLRHVVAQWDPSAETNSPTPEVETVVDLIIDHARSRPEESLGVITMGIKHANRIEESFRQRLISDEQLEEELSTFLEESQEESFFVKNLERVQGDERDAIILSIGYGKDQNGRLPYRFGPLLFDGGERRLNVAVTRAKSRITLVTSFSSHDMDPERSNAEGVKLLRQYLQYVESDGTNLGDRIHEKPALNPFEVDVRDTLENRGLELTPQYGVSGYWIDFVVKHPEQAGRYILAIECDGATYHSSDSARDRDRLRQEQLERLGWRFCRIWSTEWFSDKERAVAKVLDAYDKALQKVDQDREPSRSRSDKNANPSSEGSDGTSSLLHQEREKPRPPVPRGRPIQDYTQSQLVRLIRWIASDDRLRTEGELLAEVMTELGFKRRGPKIINVITSAIKRARR
ncbi:MAG: DUF4011 domain-containing protein [Chloroflexi bacterium]|nr:DUF4011 domain-containing protein [Chloroflexota bacterium]